MDKRGHMRGKCTVESCDCIEYEVPAEDHNCTYCGDPPAKHQLIINGPESNNNEEKCRGMW